MGALQRRRRRKDNTMAHKGVGLFLYSVRTSIKVTRLGHDLNFVQDILYPPHNPNPLDDQQGISTTSDLIVQPHTEPTHALAHAK